MEVMLNSSLAGGVVMGAACDIIVGPGFCMIAGAIAGAISAIGFLKFNPMSKERLAIHDTCGVHFLHGIPGFLGAIVCIIAIAAGHYNFENVAQLDIIFPANKTDRTVQQQAQI
jgi:ammonia channel protein AmtB